jgi:hypothetical protein
MMLAILIAQVIAAMHFAPDVKTTRSHGRGSAPSSSLYGAMIGMVHRRRETGRIGSAQAQVQAIALLLSQLEKLLGLSSSRDRPVSSTQPAVSGARQYTECPQHQGKVQANSIPLRRSPGTSRIVCPQQEMEVSDRSREPRESHECCDSVGRMNLTGRCSLWDGPSSKGETWPIRSRALLQTNFQCSPRRTAQPGNRPILGKLNDPPGTQPSQQSPVQAVGLLLYTELDTLYRP